MKSCPHCKSTYPTHFSVCPQDATRLEDIQELPAGAVLRGKYKILAKLGEGGMGAVYKALHLRFDEVCALKMVLATHLADPTFLQRFQAEALLMRKLDHPHALRVNDVDETDDGLPFIVMEFIEGESLDAVLARGALPADRAIRIAMQACEALGAAHRLGIIHRDIKPANLLLARTPDGADFVKVLDFGIAKVQAGSPLRDGASLTQTGALVGTPAYMSPEQCQGVRGVELTGASDLYSLGVVLYQMLTGGVPFKAESTVAILMAHMQQPPPDLHALRPDFSPRLVAVVQRALEKDPARRYATAEEMRQALQEAGTALDKTTLGPRPPLPHSDFDLPATTRWETPRPGAARVPLPVPPPAPPAAPPPAPAPGPAAVAPSPVSPPAPTPAPAPPVPSPAPAVQIPPAPLPSPTPTAPKMPGVSTPPAQAAPRSKLNPAVAFVGGVGIAAVLLAGVWFALRSQLGGNAPPGGEANSGNGKKSEPRPGTHPPAKPPGRPGTEEHADSSPAGEVASMPAFALRHTLAGHSDSVLAVAFTRGGRIMASGSLDRAVGLWDPVAGKSLGQLRGHTGPVYGVAFSPDGRLLASASGDTTVRLWEIAKGLTIQTLTGHADRVYSVAFGPDGATVATASKDRTVKLWNVASGQVLRIFTGHTAPVTAVVFSPDGTMLASAGEDNNAILWDVNSAGQLHVLHGHSDRVHAVAFSPDGRLVASASRDHTVRIWEVSSGKELRALRGHTGYVDSVAFSPDGKTIASGGEDQAVRIWDAASGRELGELPGQNGWVIALAYTRDGGMLAAASSDKKIRVWHTE